jgi:hypothetical protein
MQRLGPVLAAVVFMLLASACDEPSDPKALAVSATGSDGLTIHYVPCPEEHVQRVRLILRRGDDPYDGDDPNPPARKWASDSERRTFETMRC